MGPSLRYFANTSAGFLNAFISMALPLGSWRNMVACSPGFPSWRMRGEMMKGIPAACRRLARAWKSSHGTIAPKCGIGTATPST
jgi:hypothetical protein